MVTSIRLNLLINILIFGGMFFRILLSSESPATCNSGHSCPNVLELTTGNIAIIGRDITDNAAAHLLPGAGCGQGERIVEIPRRIFVDASRNL